MCSRTRGRKPCLDGSLAGSPRSWGRSPGEAGAGSYGSPWGQRRGQQPVLSPPTTWMLALPSRGAPPPRAGPTQQPAGLSARTPPPEQQLGGGRSPTHGHTQRQPVDPRPAESPAPGCQPLALISRTAAATSGQPRPPGGAHHTCSNSTPGHRKL